MLNLSCGARVKFSGTLPGGYEIEGTGVVKTQIDDHCSVYIGTIKVNGEDVTKKYSAEISYLIPIGIIKSSTPA
ncbi:hypothetical protein XaC1_20 [Xanthomonas phage XaC1]|nr:hypothetical protein XaC1_20 [Xanthomonas phage XaC1]